MTANASPLIDIRAFENGDAKTRRIIAEQVDAICQSTGFLAITNHGIAQETLNNFWQSVQNFFELSIEQKQQSKALHPGYPYGYMSNESETLSASIGNQTPPDIKETFNGGPQHTPIDITDPDALAFCYAVTPWPSQPPAFKASWIKYYEAMEALAQRIMQLFAVALKLSPNFFDSYIDTPISALRAINYPPQSRAPQKDQLRAGAHSDYGTLTILWPQADSIGLEIQLLDNTWQEVAPIPGAFIINIGDLMARWTNNRWRSTIHRVANPAQHDPASRRQSIAYFHQPNWDAVIKCLTDTEPLHEPVKSGPYLMAKFKSTVSQKDK
jgi:isopenicillin N synthase-like dioxygenase